MLRFQKNSASCGAVNSLFERDELFDSPRLFIADNIDQNDMTIDNKGIFHGRGMTAAWITYFIPFQLHSLNQSGTHTLKVSLDNKAMAVILCDNSTNSLAALR